MPELKMDHAALEAFMVSEFPQVARSFSLRRVAPFRLDMALLADPGNLRPGGTVSGPALFGLADVGVYLAVLSMIGPQALAVTTSASIDFMRKPSAGVEVLAEVELLKLGRKLAVGDVRMFATPPDDRVLVARASLTYSIPNS